MPYPPYWHDETVQENLRRARAAEREQLARVREALADLRARQDRARLPRLRKRRAQEARA